MNVVIMSRSEEKLQIVANKISELKIHMHMQTLTHTHTHVRNEEKYNREVRTISVDFSDGMRIYPNLAEQLQDLDIGVLSKPNHAFVHNILIFLSLLKLSVYCNCINCKLCTNSACVIYLSIVKLVDLITYHPPQWRI